MGHEGFPQSCCQRGHLGSGREKGSGREEPLIASVCFCREQLGACQDRPEFPTTTKDSPVLVVLTKVKADSTSFKRFSLQMNSSIFSATSGWFSCVQKAEAVAFSLYYPDQLGRTTWESNTRLKIQHHRPQLPSPLAVSRANDQGG